MGPIGVFDSGYGGLTILKSIVNQMPAYDYLYLGDNARTPYGNRSFETVYQYTLEAVRWFFRQDCALVILACNTASAKALRTIQQNDLPKMDSTRRVLGVIRPSIEAIGNLTHTRHVGVLGTVGTVRSLSYPLEISKLYPDVVVQQEACPLWVPLIENGEAESDGADYFVEKYITELMDLDKLIDCVILGCTHYPLLADKIKKYLPAHVQMVAQGDIVAVSLQDYLFRHPEIELRCRKEQKRLFYTTDTPDVFDCNASLFFGEKVQSMHAIL
jgi:glutamate racemase